MPSRHRGHEIEVGVYGPDLGTAQTSIRKKESLDGDIHNIALECLDCSEVIVDYDLTPEMTLARAQGLISDAIKDIL